MKFTKVFIVIASIFTFPTAAMADTSTSNSWTTRTESGHGWSETTGIREVRGSQVNESQSLKLEADKGDFNSASLRFDGRGFSGSASSSNQRPVDPVVYGSFVRQTENLQVFEKSTMNGGENYNFGTNTFTHSVGAQSN